MSDKDTTESKPADTVTFGDVNHTSGVCPNCGYCPHCGRGYHTRPYDPYVSPPLTWPTPPYWQPWITTCGDTGTSTTFNTQGTIS